MSMLNMLNKFNMLNNFNKLFEFKKRNLFEMKKLKLFEIKKSKLNHKIFLYLSFVIITMLILMWLSFNQATSKYINSKVLGELTSTGKVLINLINENELNSSSDFSSGFRLELQTLSKVSGFIGSTDFMLISDKDNSIIYANNSIIYPKSSIFYPKSSNNTIPQDLFPSFLESNPTFQYEYLYKLSLASSQYYLTVLRHRNSGIIIIMYKNISAFNDFVSAINLSLLLIFIFGAVLSLFLNFWLSKRVSKPVTELSTFAKTIGKGSFETKNFDYKDIEFHELSQSLNHMSAQLKHNDLEQKEFFQNITHDLRTPLMSIQGYAEGLIYDVFQEPKDIAVIMVDECQRLTSMVNDILYLSKWNSGNLKMQNVRVNLVDILESSIISTNGVAIKQSKEITFSFSTRDVFVHGDLQSLQRAFVNLLSNCVRHANSLVSITLDITGDKIVIIFHDDGSGFSQEDLNNLFKRHYNGQKGDNGIGLTIVKTVLDYHKASISPSNNIGGEFKIEFHKQ